MSAGRHVAPRGASVRQTLRHRCRMTCICRPSNELKATKSGCFAGIRWWRRCIVLSVSRTFPNQLFNTMPQILRIQILLQVCGFRNAPSVPSQRWTPPRVLTPRGFDLGEACPAVPGFCVCCAFLAVRGEGQCPRRRRLTHRGHGLHLPGVSTWLRVPGVPPILVRLL